MALEWTKERTPTWDEDKARIVGGADPGVFDARYKALRVGGLVPGTWWRVQDGGATVGYGWMDLVWGDAEILLAVAPDARGKGVGAFILERLADEARHLGLHRLYNIVRPTHPDSAKVTRFLTARGFTASEDGSLYRSVR
ncbi:MAG: GNAT family N-acetyltransferase [Deltaproteobacteria bacterium]|nr:GNAT family N-acetyltransferase [Deltaproteobacteria bacterium]